MIARVFPTRTSMCPTDKDAYFSYPDLFTPQYDEVHISTQFTWDIPKAKQLAEAWEDKGKVSIGGVAIDGESKEPFKAGLYLKKGITITTRGCPNNCSFCMVNKCGLIEFEDFPEGNIVQDNNILASSDRHWNSVMQMLRKQHAICFKGGLDKLRLTDKRIEDLQSLKIRELWLACDSHAHIKPLEKSVNKLIKAGFKRDKILCFVLIGDNMTENEDRLMAVWKAGAIPFAQLFKDKQNSINYSTEWKQFARRWSRPAIIKGMMKKVATIQEQKDYERLNLTRGGK